MYLSIYALPCLALPHGYLTLLEMMRMVVVNPYSYSY